MKLIDKVKTGENIKAAMDRQGISTTQLSQTLGISFQAVHKYIHGKSLPDVRNFYALSELLETSVNDLISTSL